MRKTISTLLMATAGLILSESAHSQRLARIPDPFFLELGAGRGHYMITPDNPWSVGTPSRDWELHGRLGYRTLGFMCNLGFHESFDTGYTRTIFDKIQLEVGGNVLSPFTNHWEVWPVLGIGLNTGLHGATKPRNYRLFSHHWGAMVYYKLPTLRLFFRATRSISVDRNVWFDPTLTIRYRELVYTVGVSLSRGTFRHSQRSGSKASDPKQFR